MPARDAEALESAVSGLVESRDRLAAMRHAARATVERYSWEAVARENVAVYEAARAYTAGRSASAIT